jgi:hypothetical protein
MSLAGTLLLTTLAAWVPQDFRTTARFSVDESVLRLQSAVAIVDQGYGRTWIHVYFFAFPLTPADVTAVADGNVAPLEKKRNSAPDLNHSRAAMHLLVDASWALTNASLEMPGLTCTFFEDPALSKGAVQSFVSDGTRLQLTAKSSTICDLTPAGGRKQRMTWDVDVSLPVFKKR